MGAFIAIAALVTATGCAGAESTKAEPAPPAVTVTATATATVTATVTPTPTRSPKPKPKPAQATQSSLFPRGYPKVVAVSSLPDQVRSWYQMSDHTKAVAIAPGVWTPLTPGASVMDAATTDMADGFCSSIKAYGREYLNGKDITSTCW